MRKTPPQSLCSAATRIPRLKSPSICKQQHGDFNQSIHGPVYLFGLVFVSPFVVAKTLEKISRAKTFGFVLFGFLLTSDFKASLRLLYRRRGQSSSRRPRSPATCEQQLGDRRLPGLGRFLQEGDWRVGDRDTHFRCQPHGGCRS